MKKLFFILIFLLNAPAFSAEKPVTYEFNTENPHASFLANRGEEFMYLGTTIGMGAPYVGAMISGGAFFAFTGGKLTLFFDKDLYESESFKGYKKLKMLLRSSEVTQRIHENPEIINLVINFDNENNDSLFKVRAINKLITELKDLAIKNLTLAGTEESKVVDYSVEHIKNKKLEQSIRTLLKENDTQPNMDFAYNIYMLEYYEAYKLKFN